MRVRRREYRVPGPNALWCVVVRNTHNLTAHNYINSVFII